MTLYLSLWRGLIPAPCRLRTNSVQPGEGMLKRVIAEAAADHGVHASDVEGERRDSQTCLVRDDAAYRMRLLGASYPRIGAALGGRDHTTIMAAVKRQRNRVAGYTLPDGRGRPPTTEGAECQ